MSQKSSANPELEMLIENPPPFAPVEEYREFLKELDQMPDCEAVRGARAEALEDLALAEQLDREKAAEAPTA